MMAGQELSLRAAAEIAAAFAELDQVAAVALGGSRATGAADASSDIDLYVYITKDVPLAFRAALAGRRGARAEIDNRFWETGDEWDDVPTGVHVDVMYRSPGWAEDELAGVLDRHEARLGYTTCVWHNVLTSRPLFDRDGWFAALQERARRPYPDALVRAIVVKNHPVLRSIFGSYRAQLLKAAEREDRVSLNHRSAAFLASYFDVLFAVNRTPHPGEKRLLREASGLPHAPSHLVAHVDLLLRLAAMQKLPSDLDHVINDLCDGLDDAYTKRPIQ